jgi:hypothetical protein
MKTNVKLHLVSLTFLIKLIAVGDFNHDDDNLNLIVTDSLENIVTILVGNG